jgi:hypothetical protein
MIEKSDTGLRLGRRWAVSLTSLAVEGIETQYRNRRNYERMNLKGEDSNLYQISWDSMTEELPFVTSGWTASCTRKSMVTPGFLSDSLIDDERGNFPIQRHRS